MNHQQILDKLAAKHLVDAIEEDICRLARDSLRFLGRQGFPYTTLESYLLPRLMNRWECVLEAPKGEVSANYQQKTCSALAVLLHKYGMQDKDITQHAIKSIRTLNKSVALSDDFARKESEIIAFLEAAPEPLKRNPSVRETLTFYRGGDVISIQYRKKFYAAYIHSIENFNSYPCLEFYDAVFDHRPNLGEIIGHPAKGKKYNDGVTYVQHYNVYGMRNVPDLANQINLIGSCISTPPKIQNLVTLDCGGPHITLFNLLDDLNELFT